MGRRAAAMEIDEAEINITVSLVESRERGPFTNNNGDSLSPTNRRDIGRSYHHKGHPSSEAPLRCGSVASRGEVLVSELVRDRVEQTRSRQI
jgi:hypothetical protein